jgi:hypothetical protein
MVINIKRVVMWSGLILASIAMLLVAVYKTFWLLMGSMALDNGPIPGVYIANLVEVPVYLTSAVTAWKWPWIAESVAGLTLVVIFARFNPWTISPFQRWLSFEYAFIIAANVAFITRMSLRRRVTGGTLDSP